MTRPSRNQDQLLIETAKRLLPEVGISGMSLQRIAEECGVNLGMFHYHFKSKSVFVRKVLESINHEIQSELEAGALVGNTSIERLKSAVTALALRTLRERKIFVSLFRDLLSGNEEVAVFLGQVHKQRLDILAPLLEQCVKDGYVEALPRAQLMSFIACGVNFPTLLCEALDRSPRKKLRLPQRIKDEIASEEAVHQRIELALRAVRRKGTS